MLEDTILVWKLRRGRPEALCRIYEKYKNDMLRLAAALLGGTAEAEDLVQEVFIALIQSSPRMRLGGSLKGYLVTCVANRARNVHRARKQRPVVALTDADHPTSGIPSPDHWIIGTEEFTLLMHALAQVPYEQREVVTLHLQGRMVFREIAQLQDVPVKTIQSRYRYGLERLRALLNGKLDQ